MKSQYRRFCSEQEVPLYHQPWWLDAVCGADAWEVALAMDKGGEITGALPYFRTRRFGLPVIQQPPFTAYSGPWLRYPDNPALKQVSRYAFEKKVFGELIAQLPRVAFFRQNFRPEVQNHLAFHWAGFRQTTRYTYVFDDTGDPEGLAEGFKNTLRTDLKKAGELTSMHRDDPAYELVFDLNRQSFQRKGQKTPYSPGLFKNLHDALQERGQSVCFIARDRITGTPHAGLYLVFDARNASVLLTGIDPAFKGSAAIYGLFWEAIRFCSQRGLSLDFEGSMEPGIEHTFRSFGARLTPYFQVWKAANRLLELAYAFRV